MLWRSATQIRAVLCVRYSWRRILPNGTIGVPFPAKSCGPVTYPLSAQVLRIGRRNADSDHICPRYFPPRRGSGLLDLATRSRCEGRPDYARVLTDLDSGSVP